MLGRHGLETYVTSTVNSGITAKGRKSEIKEARQLCDEIDNSRDTELSPSEQSEVPISYSRA